MKLIHKVENGELDMLGYIMLNPELKEPFFGLCPGQWHHLSHSSGCGAFFEGIRGKALSGTAAMNGKVLERYAELMIDKIRQMSAGEWQKPWFTPRTACHRTYQGVRTTA